jgi:amidohydrolase
MEAILQLRKDIHQHPELSGFEEQTAKRIIEFINRHHPAQIIDSIGGHGFVAIYEFGEGPTIVFRSELDALPIEETNDFEHRSLNKGISHKCGHDGHMAILSGLIFRLKEMPFKKGKIVLLFQPAEENGQGAAAMLNDPKFNIQPDYVFSLHNLPGEAMHSIIVKEDVFTATVQSVAISLKGKVAHASEPENGINPARAIAELTVEFSKLVNTDRSDPQFSLLTPICIKMGEVAYGVSAGDAQVHYTLRTWSEDVMAELKNKLADIIQRASTKHGLTFSTEWFDYFPATVNNKECVSIIRKVAADNNYTIKENEVAIRFGEDFGWFSQKYKTAMFGLGSGVDTPALHHDNYDFPDEITVTGIRMFEGITRELLS